MNKSTMAGALALAFSAAAFADESLVRFDSGFGVHPVANTGVVNTVRGVPPGGRPWHIDKLKVRIKQDGSGSITARGEGLVLAGGDSAGTRGPILQVVATLFCDAAQFTSPPADLSLGGDFEIRGPLTPTPPTPCNNPALLIRNFAVPAGSPAGTAPAPGAWFAGGTIADEGTD